MDRTTVTNQVGVPLARGITNPLGQLWQHQPNSVRRTSTLSATPGRQWSGFSVEGVARDAVFGADGQLLRTAQGRLRAKVDQKGHLESVEVTDADGTRRLTTFLHGKSIGAGFRAQLSKLGPATHRWLRPDRLRATDPGHAGQFPAGGNLRGLDGRWRCGDGIQREHPGRSAARNDHQWARRHRCRLA